MDNMPDLGKSEDISWVLFRIDGFITEETALYWSNGVDFVHKKRSFEVNVNRRAMNKFDVSSRCSTDCNLDLNEAIYVRSNLLELG